MAAFDAAFTAAGADTIPIRAPRANAICERSASSARRELLDRIIILNTRHAIAFLREYDGHFNTHRSRRASAKLHSQDPSPAHLSIMMPRSSVTTDYATCSTNMRRSHN